MKYLVLTAGSLFKLSQFSISDSWFSIFDIPEDAAGLKRIEIDDFVYIIESNLESDDQSIVVIDLGIFDGRSDVATLDRVITVGRSIYSDSVIVPTAWRPHREGSLMSITPSPGPNWRERIHFEKRPRSTNDLLVFQRTGETLNFDKLVIPLDAQRVARDRFANAILSPAPPRASASLAGIVLSQKLPHGFMQGLSLQQWYSNKLTEEQRTFVNKPHDGPVRLRGSAGTGKTISLVIKCLVDAVAAHEQGRRVRFGFLTHSAASADLVNSISESLDPVGIVFGQSQAAKVEIRTLYDLANDQLGFSLADLRPLSLDGREGRKLQMELIEASLSQMSESGVVRAQFSEVSSQITDAWRAPASDHGKRLVAEIMNEFASVLDAEGIRAGEEKGMKYISGGGGRMSWQMSLPLETDRRFVLEVHRRYRKALAEMGALSVDQMIGDFNSFLDSNRWSSVRGREGYDALFVDELHLFTSIERQTLHKLIKQAVDDEGRPKRLPIFMAYDIKQSTKDTFSQLGEAGSIFTSSSKLTNSELVKLSKVFRYTPEIAEFLTDLDASFPAVDIPGEWEAYSGEAQLAGGPKPTLTIHKDDVTLFRSVFDEARNVAMKTDGGGRRVAVLCVSAEMFETYLVASRQYKGKLITVLGREGDDELRHAGRRFIFSMPEYVAGLQFETVFLIHPNVQEAPIGAGDGMRRRFISDVYLGSSRAERSLRLHSSAERGGPSDVLKLAMQRGSLLTETSLGPA